ncbi:MAG: hypothetical protein ACRCYQ_03210 [Nocardioides sp.]
MTLPTLPTPSARAARTEVLCCIAALVFVSYAVPFFGPLASLSLPFATHAARRHLWPQASRGYSVAWSVMAWAGLWLSGLLGALAVSAGPEGGQFETSTLWLVVPLCAPDNLTAVLLPAVAAAAISAAGLFGALATRCGWLWVAAAWLAPWVHYLVFTQIPHQFVC